MDFDPLSLVCAGIGAVFLIAWPLMKTRSTMLLAQLAVSASFAAHYALEALPTAAILNLLGALHLGALLCAGHAPRLEKLGLVVIPAILLICVGSWTDWTSLLSTAGTLLIAYGRMQTGADALKRLVLGGTAFWFAHDLVVGSPLALVDLFSLLVGVWITYLQAQVAIWRVAVRMRFQRSACARKVGGQKPVQRASGGRFPAS